MLGSFFTQYILDKPEAWLDFPFGKDVAVYKIDKKMFALSSENDGVMSLNLKCDPDQAFILRDIFESVVPGYHMNKRHWNTVYLDGSIPVGELERMIDHSYGLVVKGMTRKIRLSLELAHGTDKVYCE
ncbi:MAG: putative DNA-binding protein (MmcQ/YjbR family) [Oceanicoccus sp.]|jgi:predicted DNA-binding protein (MmcQ/YjbR family)